MPASIMATISHTDNIRVLHLINSLGRGGAEAMLAKLVAGMDPGRFTNRVVTLLDPSVTFGRHVKTEAGAHAVTVQASGTAVGYLGMKGLHPNPVFLHRLRRRIREYAPHILQSWLYHSDLLATAACLGPHRPELIWNIRASNIENRHYSWSSRLVRRMLPHLSRRPAAVVVNSQAGQAAHRSLGYRPRKWQVIPNGFDTTRFQPDENLRLALRQTLGVPEKTVLIGLPARFDPQKDHKTFVRSAALLAGEEKDLAFLLVGEGTGPETPQIAALLNGWCPGLPFHLLGRRDDMQTIFPALDIMTLCSAFGEGFPNVVGEAMACGVPCVVTPVGDNPRIVGRTGLVVPTKNPPALVRAWKELIAIGPAGRRRLGRKARARIEENYPLSKIIRRYERLYAETAGVRY